MPPRGCNVPLRKSVSHGSHAQPDPTGGPGRPAHPDRLALPLRGLHQAILAGLEPRRSADRALLVGGVPALGDGPLRGPVPWPGGRELASVARRAHGLEPAAGGAWPDAGLLHPARVRRGSCTPRSFLSLVAPDPRRV